MSVAMTLGQKFMRVLLPTSVQVLAAVFISLGFFIVVHSQALLTRLGISQQALNVTRDQVIDRSAVIIDSPIASHFALITFWAGIGLVVYLICWGAYNVLIEARNQVALGIGYTNRGRWGGAWAQLLLKVLASSALLGYILGFKYALSLWLALTGPVLSQTSVSSALMAMVAVLGLALQLYVLIVLVQLTLTRWYAVETFTG
jgi:hypothetical protein